MNKEPETGWGGGDDAPVARHQRKKRVTTTDEAMRLPADALLKLDVERAPHERPADLAATMAATTDDDDVDADVCCDSEDGVCDEPSWASFDSRRGVASPAKHRGRGRGGLARVAQAYRARGPSRGPVDDAFVAWMSREGDAYGITVQLRPTGRTDGTFLFGGRVMRLRVAVAVAGAARRLEAKESATRWVPIGAYVSKFLPIEEARDVALRSALSGISIITAGALPPSQTVVV
jgi:hypothetical protein